MAQPGTALETGGYRRDLGGLRCRDGAVRGVPGASARSAWGVHRASHGET
jgi:hypothetical protein